MKVLYNWLREFVAVDLPATELAERLTLAGIEVEDVRDLNKDSRGIVVGRIETIGPHPRADRLVLCRVSTDRAASIVCGARNMKPGDLVPVATPGSLLPSGKRIEASKIRGEVSEGMLCSEAELGISDSHDGIMILPPDAPVGERVFRYLGLEDTLLDLAVNANRGDYLGVIGLAREVSALTGVPLTVPKVSHDHLQSLEPPCVELKAPDLCPRYAAMRVSNVLVRQSSLWLRMRLSALGLRAINNVVDVTNYVMLETGQPLHAFDWSTLQGGKIVVRRSGESTGFVALDGTERRVEPEDLLIADEKNPIALAGIIGGMRSGVTGTTSDLVLESAHFDPSAIRRTARRLGVRTEASYRFERGVDPEGVIVALQRAANLISLESTGALSSAAVDIRAKQMSPRQILLSGHRAATLLGVSVDIGTMREILTRLGGRVTERHQALVVEPPSFRMDWHDDADLIEEIARVQGYENYPASMPLRRMEARPRSKRARCEQRAKRIFLQRNLFEVITLSFAPGRANALFPSLFSPEAKPIALVNPISNDASELRMSLLGGLLAVLKHNLNHGEGCVRLFELGKVYHELDGKHKEEWRAAAVLCGQEEELGLKREGRNPNFLDAKGIVEDLLEELGIEPTWEKLRGQNCLHEGKAGEICLHGNRVGVLGEIHPRVAAALDLPAGIYALELDFDQLVQYGSHVVAFQPLPRYPAIVRDFAIVIKEDVPAARIIDFIKGLRTAFVQEVKVFDQYLGAPIPPRHKSLGYRITYRSAGRTLTEQEVEKVHSRMLESVLKAFEGELRT